MAVAPDDFVEGAVEGGDDVELGFVIQAAVRIKTVVDDGFDAVGHIAVRCPGRLHCTCRETLRPVFVGTLGVLGSGWFVREECAREGRR